MRRRRSRRATLPRAGERPRAAEPADRRPPRGGRRRSPVCSVLSGFAEAGMLALLAQIAAAIATGGRRVHTRPRPAAPRHDRRRRCCWSRSRSPSFRLVLQLPLSILPARIAADVQARLRRDLFARLHACLLGACSPATARAPAGDDDQSGDARRPAARCRRRRSHLAGHVRRADGLRDRAQPDRRAGSCSSCAVALFGLLRPLSVLGVTSRARTLAGAGGYAGRDRRGDPAGRGDAGVRRRRRPARADRPA